MKTEFLENLADIQYGYPFDSKHFKEQGPIRVIRIRDIKKPETPTFFDGIYDRDYVIDSGDIIVGMDGEFNCAIWALGPALLNQRVARIIPKKSVSKNYLYYMLKMKLKETEKTVTLSTVRHLLNSQLRKIEIPILPYEMQMNVAEILTKADFLRQKREHANLMANKILQAVFLRMFGDPLCSHNFPEKRICDVSVAVESGSTPLRTKLQNFSPNGVPLIKVQNIAPSGYLLLKEKQLRISDEANEKQKRSFLKEGDVLINIVGPPLGKVALVGKRYEGANINQALVLMRPNSSVLNSIYLWSLLRFPSFNNMIINMAVSVRQANINLSEMRELMIPVPPLELQEKFALFAKKMEQLRIKQLQSSEDITRLFDSILFKAFKGELVTEVN